MDIDSWFNDDTKVLLNDKRVQPLSNAEASYLIFDAYKKKLETGARSKTSTIINPVFSDFIDYLKLFPELKIATYGDNENDEEFKKKKSNLQNIRNSLYEFEKLIEIERVHLWNLLPESVDEAISLIPSLARFVEEGDEKYLKSVLETIQEISQELN